MSADERDDGDGEADLAVVLDFLPHGRTDDDRPQYEKQPLGYAMNVSDFELYELVASDDADITFGDHVDVFGPAVEARNRIDYDDLPSGAQSELDYAVEDLVDAEEGRFVDFYNEAQPITLRLHQLNLLPGIGKKLRNSILDEREKRPFESFDDLASRVNGLHNPREVLVERILEEIKEEDLKYRTFARHEEQ